MIGIRLCQVPVSYLIIYFGDWLKLLRRDAASNHDWLHWLWLLLNIINIVWTLRFTLILIVLALWLTLILKVNALDSVVNLRALWMSCEYIDLVEKIRIYWLDRYSIVGGLLFVIRLLLLVLCLMLCILNLLCILDDLWGSLTQVKNNVRLLLFDIFINRDLSLLNVFHRVVLVHLDIFVQSA